MKVTIKEWNAVATWRWDMPDDEPTQHCLMTWIQQESSKGLCPMCRQKFEWKQNDEEDE
ncbi:ubiquitin ligase subunit HrtA [Aspergillus luchuensis]|uniref:Ubiquitin ligase subunit HrtA n=1 Tax=Aspergillus kawachii TaxID=1069201 RepID=A0A146FFG0_ASPKA|nr:ubiquitin ligase subunit HrtA [Aspergillus luchuensis]